MPRWCRWAPFRRRSLAGASAVGVLVGAGLVGPPIFFLTLYLQQILGFSALAGVLWPSVLLGVGMGLVFVPLMVTATSGVEASDQGLVAGLLNTAQQLGVALGIAVLTTVAATTSQGRLDPAALTGGYAAALRTAALLALAGAVLAILVLEPSRPAKQTEHLPTGGTSS